MDKTRIKPNKSELKFLKLAYTRFYDLYEIITHDDFFETDKEIRFFYINNIVSVYSELLSYEPIQCIIELIKHKRPPMEAEISSELLKFIRNILVHFPLFSCWDDVWINSDIVQWAKKDGFINKFLSKYAGHNEIKYRMWIPSKKKMIYVDINFPKEYKNNKIYLKDIVNEKQGVIFLCGLMKNILDTQLEK